MAISMLKIRRPLGRLIFNTGIAIPGKTAFLIETAPDLYRTYETRIWIVHMIMKRDCLRYQIYITLNDTWDKSSDINLVFCLVTYVLSFISKQ